MLLCVSLGMFVDTWIGLNDQVTLAHLKEKPAPSTAMGQSSSFSASSGVRSAAARLLGGSSGSRVVGNGSSKSLGGNTRIGSMGASSLSNQMANSNFDGKGTYLIFNVGDAIFISDLNSQDKVYWLGLALWVDWSNFGFSS